MINLSILLSPITEQKTLLKPKQKRSIETKAKIKQAAKKLFAETADVVDIDWQVEDDQTEYKFNVLKEKAALRKDGEWVVWSDSAYADGTRTLTGK